MPDSLGETPSLVSDSSSHFSMSSPNVIAHPHRHLPHPDAPQSEFWRQSPTMQPSMFYQFGMPTSSDRSPSSWGRSDTPKPSAHYANSLQQFADVAVRTPPVAGYDVQRQPMSLQAQHGLPPIRDVVNNTEGHSRLPLLATSQPASVGSLPVQPEAFQTAESAQHSISTARSMAPPAETLRLSSSRKRTAEDAAFSQPSPERKKMSVSHILH